MKKQQLLLEELIIFEAAKICLFEKARNNFSLGFCIVFIEPLQNYPRLMKYKPAYVHFDNKDKIWINELNQDSYWFHRKDFDTRNKILLNCIDEIEKELLSSFYGKLLLFFYKLKL